MPSQDNNPIINPESVSPANVKVEKEDLDNRSLFEGSVQVNPTGFGTKEESFLITKKEIIFGLASPVSIRFNDILGVSKKTWLVFSSVIIIKYNDDNIIKEIRFTVTTNGLENLSLKREIYQILLEIWRNKSIEASRFDKILKIVSSSHTDFQLFNFSKPNPWFKFIITTIIVVILSKILINIFLK